MQNTNSLFHSLSGITNTIDTDSERTLFAYAEIDSPLGTIIAVADDAKLYLLDFVDQPQAEKKIRKLMQSMNGHLAQDNPEPIRSIATELTAYFAGTLRTFTTPVALIGTPFSVSVWQKLQTIPYGQTVSYQDLATAVGKPTACRAAARANSINLLPIIIPCHRVINANGDLGGYNCSIERKAWLLEHEKSTEATIHSSDAQLSNK